MPDSPDTCGRKPFTERKSCGLKNIRICVDGAQSLLESYVMFQVKSILIFWSLKIWLSFVILLRFSQTCKFWSSKASWRLLFSLLSIILTDLLENKTLLLITGSKGHGFWFVIGGFRSVLCVSVFQGSLLVVIVLNYDWRQPKTQFWRRLLNFRVRMFVKSAKANHKS